MDVNILMITLFVCSKLKFATATENPFHSFIRKKYGSPEGQGQLIISENQVLNEMKDYLKSLRDLDLKSLRDLDLHKFLAYASDNEKCLSYVQGSYAILKEMITLLKNSFGAKKSGNLFIQVADFIINPENEQLFINLMRNLNMEFCKKFYMAYHSTAKIRDDLESLKGNFVKFKMDITHGPVNAREAYYIILNIYKQYGKLLDKLDGKEETEQQGASASASAMNIPKKAKGNGKHLPENKPKGTAIPDCVVLLPTKCLTVEELKELREKII